MNFLHTIKTPHLPKSKVGCVLIGDRYRERLEIPLKSKDIEVIWVPDNSNVDPRLCGHVDLSVIHMGGNKLVVQENVNVNHLTKRGFNVVSALSAQSTEYPADTELNGCILGSMFIHNPIYTDNAVLENIGDRNIINVSQGYAKCSICVVDEKSIITSDGGIAGAAAKCRIDVLLIKPGFIELEGFDCGFIGGSTFKLSEHELAFTGNLETHPDKASILDFLHMKKIDPIFLTDHPIFDIGSSVPILEYKPPSHSAKFLFCRIIS